MSRSPSWWESFYDEHLADVLLERTDPREIARAADFLVAELGLAEGMTVLDQCCGTGRIAWALADRGMHVLGVDLIAAYVARARGRTGPGRSRARFETADAFAYRARPACDAAFNWWTSFGYAADDDANIAMLVRGRESIRAGGRYALDFMNVPALYRGFRPHEVTRAGDVLLLRESRLDLVANVIHKDWTYVLGDGRRVRHRTAVRLYDPAALCGLFRAAGFDDIRVFGDLDGSPLALESPRCIVSGRNPS